MIGRRGERGSGISVLAARDDDDDDDVCRFILCKMPLEPCVLNVKTLLP